VRWSKTKRMAGHSPRPAGPLGSAGDQVRIGDQP
jgi:hypothetical protein